MCNSKKGYNLNDEALLHRAQHSHGGWWLKSCCARHSFLERGSQNVVERVAEVAAVLSRVPFSCNGDLWVRGKIALLLKMPAVAIHSYVILALFFLAY